MNSAWRTGFLAWTLLLPLSPWAQPVQVVTETTPFVYLQDGKIAGPATEVLEKTLQLAGIKDYRLNMYPWARAYDMALNEPNVLIYLVARTPEREPKFQWVGEFLQIRYHLYKLRERANIHASNLDTARSYTIGVMRDDLRHQYLQQQGFTRLVMSAQTSENFAQLLKRKVDMVPLSEAGAEAQCRATSFDCAGLERVLSLDALTTGLYMAYSLATPPAVVQRTQAAFKQLKANGTVQRTMEAKASTGKAP
ncbi:transporter substrate-binding domain-containing protein [Rhodoferax sp.]|uniref:substrate-binding periplasmic protein n=1 Tax=Rhodoferax sp. TaxID=50421 RepID=UPI0025DB15C0|nr:transporter substrate-binding domain-containing protein [Rhodoferax sp.]